MKYAVDKIIDNIIVLENLNDNSIININKDNLEYEVKEGNILIYKDNKYILDKDYELLRKKEIEERFKRLRKS